VWGLYLALASRLQAPRHRGLASVCHSSRGYATQTKGWLLRRCQSAQGGTRLWRVLGPCSSPCVRLDPWDWERL